MRFHWLRTVDSGRRSNTNRSYRSSEKLQAMSSASCLSQSSTWEDERLFRKRWLNSAVISSIPATKRGRSRYAWYIWFWGQLCALEKPFAIIGTWGWKISIAVAGDENIEARLKKFVNWVEIWMGNFFETMLRIFQSSYDFSMHS
jgi:hypothetical protein